MGGDCQSAYLSIGAGDQAYRGRHRPRHDKAILADGMNEPLVTEGRFQKK